MQYPLGLRIMLQLRYAMIALFIIGALSLIITLLTQGGWFGTDDPNVFMSYFIVYFIALILIYLVTTIIRAILLKQFKRAHVEQLIPEEKDFADLRYSFDLGIVSKEYAMPVDAVDALKVVPKGTTTATFDLLEGRYKDRPFTAFEYMCKVSTKNTQNSGVGIINYKKLSAKEKMMLFEDLKQVSKSEGSLVDIFANYSIEHNRKASSNASRFKGRVLWVKVPNDRGLEGFVCEKTFNPERTLREKLKMIKDVGIDLSAMSERLKKGDADYPIIEQYGPLNVLSDEESFASVVTDETVHILNQLMQSDAKRVAFALIGDKAALAIDRKSYTFEHGHGKTCDYLNDVKTLGALVESLKL